MNIFYGNASELWGILISTPLIYLTTIVFIRISGKRSMSKMNNFDWIVTVAIGSLVASTILSKDVALIEGIIAIGLLLFLQLLLTKFTQMNVEFAALIKPSASLIFFNGTYLSEVMATERITKGEILAAIRQAHVDDIDNVVAVVLETDSNLSVILKSSNRIVELAVLDDVIH